ncbi:hypothetical protein [Agrobacterium sp. NPDC089420]|uniref:hypothetical protein n=1 Tax=Agrobacterium sp. NPDC089420 TaxID=3363918 RepID=UPI00384A91BE
MVLALPNKWLWDSWYAHDGEWWHGYFLQADKSLIDPRKRHRNVSIGHAVSKDLVDWTHLGACFAPSAGPAFDDETTWTGCVVRDETGPWHLFYTGTSKAEDAKVQRIGHATSEDLHNWTRVGDGLCLDLVGPNADQYEVAFTPGHWYERAMRDPWVMRSPDGDEWLMFFTARAPGIDEANEGGAIGFATSRDLYTWELQPPVFVGGFGHHEVPQVFEIRGQWYCLFCCGAGNWSKNQIAIRGQEPVVGSHYLIGESPRGPWQIAPGDFLDSGGPLNRYAARILEQDGLKILGFARGTDGQFIGEITSPDSVIVDEQGLLHVVKQQPEDY